MLVDLPEALKAGGVEKSTHVCPIVRDGSGSPQWCGARWRRQGTISKGLIDSTEIVSALRNHNGTKSLDELLGDAFLFGVNVNDVQRHHREVLLTTGCGTAKWASLAPRVTMRQASTPEESQG